MSAFLELKLTHTLGHNRSGQNSSGEFEKARRKTSRNFVRKEWNEEKNL
jgi:hypothetical protein